MASTFQQRGWQAKIHFRIRDAAPIAIADRPDRLARPGQVKRPAIQRRAGAQVNVRGGRDDFDARGGWGNNDCRGRRFQLFDIF